MGQHADDQTRALQQLRAELAASGRTTELEALDRAMQAATPQQQAQAQRPMGDTAVGGRSKGRTYLKLKKKYYTPAEVARRVGVSRQTIVKWIERGELEAELTPGGHHRIPASVFHREGRGEAVQLIPVDDE